MRLEMRLDRPRRIQALMTPRHCGWSEVVVRGRIELPTFRFSGGRSYRLSYLTLPEQGPGAVLTGFEPATSTLTGWRALQAALQDHFSRCLSEQCPQRDSNPCRRLERAVS
jgi:hypothetical protein